MEQIPPFNIALKQLISLLNKEKDALLAGDYTILKELTKEKLTYSAILNKHLLNPALTNTVKAHARALQSMQKLARENEGLLASAKYGVQSAQKRLNNLEQRKSTVGTYTEDGYKLRTHDAGMTRQKTA